MATLKPPPRKPWQEWLDQRTGLVELWEHEVTTKVVPKHRRFMDFTGCFGGISLIFVVIQILSGIVLLVNYVPHPDYAFNSVQLITNEVRFGAVIRSVHAVGGSYLVILLLIHMGRVFITGAYKTPRELHWVSGCLLFFIMLAMNFSGYLLPWSQLSYWASTVGTESPGSIPLIGEVMVKFMRGSEGVSEVTLGRFFALHVWMLPLGMLVLLVAHFMMIRKTGIAEPL